MVSSGLSAFRLGLVPCLVRFACRTVCTVSALCTAFVFWLAPVGASYSVGPSVASIDTVVASESLASLSPR